MAAHEVTHAWETLTGQKVTPAFACRSCIDHTFQIVIANIDTTVVVRAEGSHDGSRWFNMDDSEVDRTYTADGTYMLHKGNFICNYVRFVFVSETGGTAVTVDPIYSGRGRGF